MKKSSFFLLTVVGLSLAGCVATTGGLAVRGNGLPDHYADIASDMVSLARRMCMKITGYADQSKDDWNKVRKLDGQDWQIRRFFTSNTSWVKGEAISQGVMGDLYYEPNSGTFVCGDYAWGKYEGAAQIRFVEYGAQSKPNPLPSMPVVAATPLPSPVYALTQPAPSSSAVERRTLAVRWEGYGNLMVGEAVIQQNKRVATLSIQLPGGDGTCTGMSQANSDARGVWTVSCSNKLSAAGTLTTYGTGKGASGSGKDALGRAVEFTMGGSN